MGQKMCFSDSYVIFGVQRKNYNNFHYFLQKEREIPYSRNVKLQSAITRSGSIKDRVVKFAYSMGFSEMADRMV